MNIPKDLLWKGIIEDLFSYFVWYFLPDLAKNEMDFSKGFEFLDKELASLLPESERKKRYADKLVKFYTKSGEPIYMLLHIEVQGYDDLKFAERMFEYYYRIRERWQTKVCAFVIYTNENPQFQPTEFAEDCYGTSISYKFPTFVLFDKSEQALEVADNPFSLVMKVAQKALQKALLVDSEQLIWKTALVRELFAKGYEAAVIRNILNFVRYYVRFKAKAERHKIEQTIETFTKPPKPMGIEEAILTYAKEQGEIEGTKKAVFGMFAEGLSLDAIVRITKLPLDIIQELKKEWEKTK